MIYVGIDFSLNSPGLCIKREDNSYEFISFYNNKGRSPEKPILKQFQTHVELESINALTQISYNRLVGNKDFLLREREKLIDGDMIANLIVNYLKSTILDDEVQVALEGFSYGSTGNSFIDIVQYNSFLRYRLTETYGADNIFIFQPSHVKKLAGKGNGNKHYMVKSFQDNVLNDLSLENSIIWNWCKGKDFSEKIPKPIDDLVDSYFILQSTLKLKCLDNK
jgi:hypothetical protein